MPSAVGTKRGKLGLTPRGLQSSRETDTLTGNKNMKQNEVTSMIEEKMVEEQGKEKDSICYLR